MTIGGQVGGGISMVTYEEAQQAPQGVLVYDARLVLSQSALLASVATWICDALGMLTMLGVPGTSDAERAPTGVREFGQLVGALLIAYMIYRFFKARRK